MMPHEAGLLIRRCSGKINELYQILAGFEEMYYEPSLYADELHQAWILAGSLVKQVSGLVTIFVSEYETDDRYQMKGKLTTLKDSFEALGKPSGALYLSVTERKSLLGAVKLALAEVRLTLGSKMLFFPRKLQPPQQRSLQQELIPGRLTAYSRVESSSSMGTMMR